MSYGGVYTVFDNSRVKTYPVCERANKLDYRDILEPDDVLRSVYPMSDSPRRTIDALADDVVAARREGKPVICFTGAHSIKNGFGLILSDLVNRGMFTLVAGNGATSIHDFELALFGQTSECVPMALEQGQFGMAWEFNLHNAAIAVGNELELGYGESLGRCIVDEGFRRRVCDKAGCSEVADFQHPEVSLLCTCYKNAVPFTVHVSIGTDVIDQHASFDGGCKGACSGRDFLIYANEISRLTKGGVVLNVGSAVTGPEVLLKAVSMAANVGKPPKGLTTANFDFKTYDSAHMQNEQAHSYYFRDQKSVRTRIPDVFEGAGYQVQGNMKETLAAFYQAVVARCDSEATGDDVGKPLSSKIKG